MNLRKYKIFILGMASITVIGMSYYLIDRFSYAREKSFYRISNKENSTLQIGIIGDSWADGDELKLLLSKDLASREVKNTIISSGQSGAKSKAIYQNLFSESNDRFSTKFIVERNPKYCIVFAGVNDAIGQLGADYYTHHMSLIIKTLIHYKIKPVIVELPEFGIIEHTGQMNYLARERNKVFATFTNSGKLDNIKAYRRALVETLKSENLMKSVIFVHFDKVCTDYDNCKDLFADYAHLSSKGKKLLSGAINSELEKDINAQ
ncbi:SGNH/GDSL hydrolase family protein [Dyadobacter sp. CY323]|uniref:SGNH/GDSL hydrolase family protein n=1 Tax=Dyadobacter sp. CY323 TaxID=2907302 RepID=UPI001F2498B5|nr:SGNH/GDSL hydrolase family protein [Dyadobacter sp. CY323]MCE6991392.1 SGNH/GDSL hydrolase family protein [Dyadobacter sp. CY323]